jgi:beta-lactamase class A
VTKRLIDYRFPGILPVILIVAIIIGSSTVGFTRNTGAAPVVLTPVASPDTATPVATPNSNILTQAQVEAASASLSAEIPQILSNDTGVYGVIVIDPAGTIVYEHNADVPFISASLYKLPLMAQIYSMIEAGTITLDQQIVLDELFFPGWEEAGDSYYSGDLMGMTTSVEEALFAAGAYSSNVGALALASLTSWTAIDAAGQMLGMTSTHLVVSPSALVQWPPIRGESDDEASLNQAVAFIELQAMDGPVMMTTPRDIAHFFSMLLDGKVISASASAGITAILAQQMVDDRFPQLLPEGTELVHKTGNLEHIVHDAGAIYTSSGPVILAALSEDIYDDSVATWIIQELAKTTFDTFTLPTS